MCWSGWTWELGGDGVFEGVDLGQEGPQEVDEGQGAGRVVVGFGAGGAAGGVEDALVEQRAAHAALREQGEGFDVTAASGSALMPADADTATEALRVADQRMYAAKLGTSRGAEHQSKDVLIRVLAERHPDLGDHLNGVAELAEGVGRRLGLEDQELAQVRHAAELHDIGKVAIPDSIIDKPGPLDDEEWAFMRRHTIIGQRILAAAPALAPVGELVRSSHERFDGGGYPDGLSGKEIPLGARIIAECDSRWWRCSFRSSPRGAWRCTQATLRRWPAAQPSATSATLRTIASSPPISSVVTAESRQASSSPRTLSSGPISASSSISFVGSAAHASSFLPSR